MRFSLDVVCHDRGSLGDVEVEDNGSYEILEGIRCGQMEAHLAP